MSRRVLLVRHPPVAKAWAGRCYGRSDMGWSREGYRMACELTEQLVAEPLSGVVHSGAIRTRRLAEMVARRAGIPARMDLRWLERDFGTWEGRTWNSIWRETESLMDKMMTHPDSFRPGGGETGAALMARVEAAWDALGPGFDILVVSHGGPIAALRALLTGHNPKEVAGLIPQHGEIIAIADGPAGFKVAVTGLSSSESPATWF